MVIYQFYDSKLKNNNPLFFKIWKKVGSQLAASSTSHHEENKDYFSQVHKYYTYLHTKRYIVKMQKLAESLSLLPRTSHYIVNHRIHNKDRINQNLNVSNTVFLIF